MNTRFKRLLFDYHILASTVSFLVLLITFVYRWWCSLPCDLPVIITILGGIVSFAFLVQKQQLDETRLFKELFQEFNARYDKMNEKMNAIKATPTGNSLKEKEEDTLNDYFNLCGEEYLYYKKGYIDATVWRTWENGMQYFLENGNIRKKWQQEQKSDSYYGLTLPEKKINLGVNIESKLN